MQCVRTLRAGSPSAASHHAAVGVTATAAVGQPDPSALHGAAPQQHGRDDPDAMPRSGDEDDPPGVQLLHRRRLRAYPLPQPSPLDLKRETRGDEPLPSKPPRNAASFCIDALLGRREVVMTRDASSDCSSTPPCSSRSASASPEPEPRLFATAGYGMVSGHNQNGNEDDGSTAAPRLLTYAAATDDYGGCNDIIMANKFQSSDFPVASTAAAAAFVVRDHHRGRNGGGFGFVHGSSAFQPLPRADANANNSNNSPGPAAATTGPASVAVAAAAAAAAAANRSNVSAGQLQQMQLEWFARAGMFYAGPRLHDLTGTVYL